MISLNNDNLAMFTPEGYLTLWGTYQHFKEYIWDNYDWNAESTKQEHDRRIKRGIKSVLLDHDTTAIHQYPDNIDEIIKAKLDEIGKASGTRYRQATVNQYGYLIRYIIETAEAHYLRVSDKAAEQDSSQRVILTGHTDTPAVRQFLNPSQELDILKKIIPGLLSNGEARLILIQMSTGLRENECCGLNWSMLKKEADTGVCKILVPQSTSRDSNSLKLGGKSGNAPRIVVLQDFVFNLLMGTKRKLLDNWVASGRDSESFENAPIGCQGNILERRCATKHMTEFANHLFEEIGIRKDELASLSAELIAMYHEKRDAGLYADINDYRSPTCYILRRSTATHMIALQYTEADRQYSLGHRIDDPSVDRRVYTEDRKQLELKQKLTQRPLLNPTTSLEYTLKVGEVLAVHGHEETIIVPPDAGSILLEIAADEPGDAIEVTIEHDGEEGHQYTVISHLIPIDPDQAPNQYSKEIDIQRDYHALYAKQTEDFLDWIQCHFGNQEHLFI